MKRKVVQHGPSTLIVSLPAKWTQKHHVERGSEIEVEEQGDTIILSPRKIEHVEKAVVDINEYKEMIPRFIHAMYKRGIDELTLTYKSPETFEIINNSIGAETLGFEIFETGRHSCIIKNVAGESREFDQMLRQTFLLLLTMGEEGLTAMKEGHTEQLIALISLERANNRFTTLCRRHLNTNGAVQFDKIGPLYYIIEQLERIADNLKYLYAALGEIQKLELEEHHIEIFRQLCLNTRTFYSTFYKFNPEDIGEMKRRRNTITEELLELVKKARKPIDALLFHHFMALNNNIFSLVDPYLVLVGKSFIVQQK